MGFVKELLASVPVSEKVVTLEPRDPSRPPPGLARVWTEVMTHKHEIRDLMMERVDHERRWAEASALHQQVMAEVERKIVETTRAYEEALTRWDLMQAPLRHEGERHDAG